MEKQVTAPDGFHGLRWSSFTRHVARLQNPHVLILALIPQHAGFAFLQRQGYTRSASDEIAAQSIVHLAAMSGVESDGAILGRVKGHDRPVRIDVAVGLRIEVDPRFAGGESEQISGQAGRPHEQ